MGPAQAIQPAWTTESAQVIRSAQAQVNTSPAVGEGRPIKQLRGGVGADAFCNSRHYRPMRFRARVCPRRHSIRRPKGRECPVVRRCDGWGESGEGGASESRRNSTRYNGQGMGWFGPDTSGFDALRDESSTSGVISATFGISSTRSSLNSTNAGRARPISASMSTKTGRVPWNRHRTSDWRTPCGRGSHPIVASRPIGIHHAIGWGQRTTCRRRRKPHPAQANSRVAVLVRSRVSILALYWYREKLDK